MPWTLRGLRDGVLTTAYPRRPDPYADEFRAAVTVTDPYATGDVRDLCPTNAITRDDTDRITLDRGRCVLCGRCVTHRPAAFTWATGSEPARLTRTALVVPETPEDDRTLARLRADLADRVRRLRRSVFVRHVDTGSDGTAEWEIAALFNPVYDAQRLGISITTTPRHADLLLVTGVGASGMAAPLARTVAAMPQPVVVIAVGTDAISGGLVDPAGGIGDQVPVDVWVPGAPPSPFAILHGILLALGRT